MSETLAHVISYEFCEISKNTFFTEEPLATASRGSFSEAFLFFFCAIFCDLSYIGLAWFLI